MGGTNWVSHKKAAVAPATKQFTAGKGVSWAKLMLAQYDRYDDHLGGRLLRLGGSYVDERGHSEGEITLAFEVTGTDLIDQERPYPGPGHAKGHMMVPRTWWIRGRRLTGEKVEGYFNPLNQFAILQVEQRERR